MGNPTKLYIRRGAAADWTAANPILAEGEMGHEKDTDRLKIGDGTTPWNSLPYIGIGDDVAQYELQLDSVGGGKTYVGEANPGSSTDQPVWRIKRIQETGPDVSIEWADGDANFDNVWDDRASLSYF